MNYKLSISNNRTESERKIIFNLTLTITDDTVNLLDEWLEYHISLGLSKCVIDSRVTNESILFNNIITFYSNIIKIRRKDEISSHDISTLPTMMVTEYICPTIQQGVNPEEFVQFIESKDNRSFHEHLVDAFKALNNKEAVSSCLKVCERSQLVIDNPNYDHIFNVFHQKAMRKFFHTYGFMVLRDFYDLNMVNIIHETAKSMFDKMADECQIQTGYTEDRMKELFNIDRTRFLAVGKQLQNIPTMHNMATNENTLKFLKFIGLETPMICTRPVFFTNHKSIAVNPINHTVPPHQDWASMQGSINSVIIWTPIVDITDSIGPLNVIPGSHYNGLTITNKKKSFGIVKNCNDKEFVPIKIRKGDALVFSSFLVHKSGNNISDNIRWSMHFRFNDVSESSYLERGYPSPYTYSVQDSFITPDFDTKKELQEYYLKT